MAREVTTMFRVALKNLVAHKFRSIALVLTVVLGVSFVSGTYVLTDTITEVFDDLFSEAFATVDVSVRSESALGTDAAREPVPESLLPTLASVDGVAATQGSVFALGLDIIDADGDRVGNPMAPSFGGSWPDEELLSPYSLRAGRRPSGAGEVAIDARSFEDGGFALGDEVQLVGPDGPQMSTIVGVAGFGDASNLAGATLALFDLPTAQTVMRRVGVFDSIDLRAEDGVSESALQERVAAVLPARFEAITGDALTAESNDAVDEGLSFFKTFLLVFAVIALFVGAFIIYNTFGIVVAQRTRELALLRALGASGRQVMLSVIGESAVLGAVASAIGLGVGMLLAMGLKALLSGLGFEVPSGDLVLLPRTILVALIGGTAITTISAVAPAIRASRVPPIAALGDVAPQRRGATVRRNVLGAVLGVAGIVLVLTGLDGGSLASVGLGAAATFVGVAMVAPMVARPVSRLVGAPAAHLRGAAGTIARQNAMRSARRTAATASALMVGTALMAGSLILSSSFTESVDRAVTKGALSDLVITTPSQLGFSPALAEDARDVDGVAAVHPYRFGLFKLDGSTEEVVGIPPDAIDVSSEFPSLDVRVEEGDVQELTGESIAVSNDVADDRGWSIGDSVPVTFPTGDATLRIVARYDETTLVGDFLVGDTTFANHFADTNDYLVLVSIEPGADLRTVQAELQAIVDRDYPGLDVMDRDQYIGDVKDQVNQFLSLITALLSLAVLIALLGVLITMLLAVFERTRELGLLRAVGMSRRQTRSMVRWEAAIVSVYGAILGLVLGVFFGLALTGALEDEGVTAQVLPIGSLVALAIVIALLGIAAAVYPARRAARLDILRAISHQ